MAAMFGILLILSTFVIDVVPQRYRMCDDIRPPANGKIKIKNLNSLYFVQCNHGFNLHGKALVKCIDGQWESLPPKCIKKSENACPDILPPENGLKECDEGVLTLGSACRFSCLNGYRLQGLRRRQCMADFKWSGIPPKCISESRSNTTCPVPPELKNGRIVGCSPNKVPTSGMSCHFFCNGGYDRSGPSSLQCQDNGKLTDTDGNDSNPECVESILNQSTDDEHGKNLQRPAPNYSAHRQPEGQNIKPKTTPRANNRYSRWQNGSCETRNGDCEQVCNEQKNRTRCSCHDGYHLQPDGKSCVDIDECAIRNRNNCHQNCHNTPGGYTCSCDHGYRLIDGYKCEGCKKDYFWVESERKCVECPRNSYTDSEASMSIDECLCLPGFFGDPKNGIECQDINECDDDNFGCFDKCINIPGSAYCSCQFGYTLDRDNKTCIDLDECSIKNGGCQGICHNSVGSFYCSCPEGFRSSNKDQYTCDDIDECLQDNGGCAHKCHNFAGGYYCSCEDGHRLDSGLHNCTGTQCAIPTIPHYSTMKCKKNKKVLPVTESYAVGTRCNFLCAKGFKISTESNRIECQADGTWKGPVPECKAQQCPALPVPENGAVHPKSCARKGNFVKRRCTFTCHPGYQLKTLPVYTCTNKLKWSTEEAPECQPVKILPTIKCPADITVDLLPGQKRHNITISTPESNVEDLKIQPDWVFINVPVPFPAGTTDVLFTASESNSKQFARCSSTVNVIDKEAPVFEFCPSTIQKDNGGAYGVLIEWEEPLVTDNVAVESIESTMKNNSTLTPGTYVVQYIAKDTAGNSASCYFDIIINRMQCDDLPDPLHGRANCMHFRSGKFCQPECDDGYIRHPSEPDSFSCDNLETWVPGETISDCLRYISPGPTGCPEGYELEENIETEEFICIEID